MASDLAVSPVEPIGDHSGARRKWPTVVTVLVSVLALAALAIVGYWLTHPPTGCPSATRSQHA